MKDLSTQPRKPKRLHCFERVNSILLNEILCKKRDLRAPLIKNEIEGMIFDRSLLDYGASVNFLPKVPFDQLRFGILKPHILELQLVDGSIREPYGVLEDVIIKAENFQFLVDFIVVDMKSLGKLSHAPIILGRLFLATSKTITHRDKGIVALRVGKNTIELLLANEMKYPQDSSEGIVSKSRPSSLPSLQAKSWWMVQS